MGLGVFVVSFFGDVTHGNIAAQLVFLKFLPRPEHDFGTKKRRKKRTLQDDTSHPKNDKLWLVRGVIHKRPHFRLMNYCNLSRSLDGGKIWRKTINQNQLDGNNLDSFRFSNHPEKDLMTLSH